jgi:hypothetical protein
LLPSPTNLNLNHNNNNNITPTSLHSRYVPRLHRCNPWHRHRQQGWQPFGNSAFRHQRPGNPQGLATLQHIGTGAFRHWGTPGAAHVGIWGIQVSHLLCFSLTFRGAALIDHLLPSMVEGGTCGAHQRLLRFAASVVNGVCDTYKEPTIQVSRSPLCSLSLLIIIGNS